MSGGIQDRGPIEPNTPTQTSNLQRPATPDVDAGALNGRTVHLDEPAPAPRSRNSIEPGPSSRTVATASVEPAGENRGWHRIGRADVSVGPRREALAREPHVQRQLSSVSKKIIDLDRHPEAQVGHLKQLQNDFHAHESAGRIPQARDTFNVLIERTDEYHSLFMDLQFVKGLGKDMKRWKTPLPTTLAKKLARVEVELNDGRIAEGRALLRSIRTDIQALHAPLRYKRDFRANASKLRQQYDGFANIAKRVKQTPELKARLAAYDNAKHFARYQAKTSSEELKAALDRIESTGADLVEGLATAVDAKANPNDASPADKALRKEAHDLICSTFDGSIERAQHVKPANLEQWNLHRRLTRKDRLHQATLAAEEMRSANRLLSASGARGDDRSAQRPPKSDEAKYFGRLQGQYSRLRSLQLFREPMNYIEFPGQQREVVDDLNATLKQLPGWDSNAAPGVNPPNYTQALADLDRAGRLADTLVRLRSETLREKVNDLDPIAATDKKADTAVEIVTDLSAGDPSLVMLGSLAQEEKIKLLDALRGGRRMEHLPHVVLEAQSTMYKAIAIDAQFLNREKQIRAEVIEALMTHDKHRLQRAQAEWPVLSQEAKLEIYKLVATTYSTIANFHAPEIVFDKLPPSIGAVFEPEAGQIIVNSSQSGLNDFETMMNTIFHENSHNWQFQMMDSLKKDPESIKDGDPRLRQAQLFAANRGFYDVQPDEKPQDVGKGKQPASAPATNHSLAYREQPLEAHAFFAGRKMARDLMRALNT